MPSISIIKITDYLEKVTDLLNKVFIAVTVISAITIVIGLIVISSAIIVQGKIKEFQNLIFKILGFSKVEAAWHRHSRAISGNLGQSRARTCTHAAG